ncbi:MAG: hypothetical protein ABSD72_00310 [Terracidiphilus sp.]
MSKRKGSPLRPAMDRAAERVLASSRHQQPTQQKSPEQAETYMDTLDTESIKQPAGTKFKWQDALGVVGFLAGIGGMQDLPLTFRISCYVACAVCLCSSFSSHKNWPVRRRWMLGGGVSVFMIILIFFAVRAKEPYIPSAEENASATASALAGKENSKTAVELECYWDHLPIPVPAGKLAHVMLLNRKARTSGMGLFDVLGDNAKNSSWPAKSQLNAAYPKKAPHNYGETIYHCDLSNQGNTKLFDVALTFRLNYATPPPGEKQEYPYEVVANPLPPGDTFTFYVVNECPTAVVLIQPEQYSARILGENQRQRFRLLRPHRNPAEPIMPLFPSSVDWTGEPCN